MYVMIDEMAVPLSSGMYFTLLSQGAFKPLSGAGILPPTGGNLMMIFIGAAVLVTGMAFVSALLAAKWLNRKAHAAA